MVKIEYLFGQKLGECIFLFEEETSDRRQRVGRFLCFCGNEFSALIGRVKNGYTKSCGCIRKNIITKHGQARRSGISREYVIWENMISRCYNENSTSFKFYSKNRIQVCDRWRHSFENFYEDMGAAPTPKHSLDRFPNKTGNYEPNNCRWATPKQQANNRTNNLIIEINNEQKTLKEWCEYLGVDYALTRNRYRNLKWSIDRLFIKNTAA